MITSMIPRYERTFSLKRQLHFWIGKEYKAMKSNEFLLNHARSGIVLSLRSCLPNGGKVGMMAYNCKSVVDSIVASGCSPIFIDVTKDLMLNLDDLKTKSKSMECIIVTNLLGIQNDIFAIQSICPNIPIIIDNAQGYALPPQGDFTVYSINQGKYPSLGDGGILYCNNCNYISTIQSMYDEIPDYTSREQMNLYLRLLKYVFYSNLGTSILTRKIINKYSGMIPKVFYPNFWGHSKDSYQCSNIKIKKMCKGIARIYRDWIDEHKNQKLKVKYMDIVHTNSPKETIKKYLNKGIESGILFKNWMSWATKYGYKIGDCPISEYIISHIVMLPNYYKYK